MKYATPHGPSMAPSEEPVPRTTTVPAPWYKRHTVDATKGTFSPIAREPQLGRSLRLWQWTRQVRLPLGMPRDRVSRLGKSTPVGLEPTTYSEVKLKHKTCNNVATTPATHNLVEPIESPHWITDVYGAISWMGGT